MSQWSSRITILEESMSLVLSFSFFPLSHLFFLCDRRISSSAGTNSNSNDKRSFMAPRLVGALGAYKRLQMTHSYHHISVTYSRSSFLCCHCVNEIESVKSIIIVQCTNTCIITTNILGTAAPPLPPPPPQKQQQEKSNCYHHHHHHIGLPL